jgi:hypothetical protein
LAGLIKDYDIEIYYHPGKANVVEDALSRKAHCSCLSIEAFSETLCWEMRKLNLEIIPQGSLNHIAVETTLKDSINIAQQHDEGVNIIKQMLAQGEEKYKCFQVDHKGVLWFNGVVLYPRTINFVSRYWTRHICPSFPCTPAIPRCTKI